MEPIRVPAPPKTAFNKHRRVSDLIRKQVNHFKHLEQKMPDTVREQIPQHHVVTEDDAAKYIAAMTQVLLSGELRTTPTKTPRAVVPSKPAKPSSRVLTLAAAAGSESKPTRHSKPAKKSSGHSGKGKRK